MPGKTREQLQEEFDEGVRRLGYFINEKDAVRLNVHTKKQMVIFLGAL